MNLSGLSDTQIWNSLKKGDDWAISYIYSEYSEKLYLYGLKFTADRLLVEDALQDLFADLIKKRKRLGHTDNILFYLLKSFKRKLLRKIKAEKRYKKDEKITEYRFDVTWSIEHELILKEVSEQKSKMLLQALNKLTPRQKEAIYLRFSKELDYNAVAGIMDISVEACRNLISKAISILKKCIDDTGQKMSLLFMLLKVSFNS